MWSACHVTVVLYFVIFSQSGGASRRASKTCRHAGDADNGTNGVNIPKNPKTQQIQYPKSSPTIPKQEGPSFLLCQKWNRV